MAKSIRDQLITRPELRVSATRAIKNARRLQRLAPQIMPGQEPIEGYASVIPPEALSKLHQMDRTALADVDKRLATLPEPAAAPGMRNLSADPLFHGTLYFVQVQFTIQSGNTQIAVSAADLATAVQYATLAAGPIAAYASQYGPNQVLIHPTVLTYPVTLANPSYNDTQLRQWVDDIVAKNNLPTTACVVVLNPQGVVNVDGDPGQGIGGYHGKSSVPFCFVNLFGQNLTVPDGALAFAPVLSHEIAEMVVDPQADDLNPEVCDGCAGNCGNFFLSYFDDREHYIVTLQGAPPNGLAYGFYINSIVKPAFAPTPAQQCPADPNQACNYGPPPRIRVPGPVAHEITAAWLIELWLLIHGPDPAPIDSPVEQELKRLSTIRAIEGLARCLNDRAVEEAIFAALAAVRVRVAATLSSGPKP